MNFRNSHGLECALDYVFCVFWLESLRDAPSSINVGREFSTNSDHEAVSRLSFSLSKSDGRVVDRSTMTKKPKAR